MLTDISNSIVNGNTIDAQIAGSRHGVLQVIGTPGELTGYLNLVGDEWKPRDTYTMEGNSDILELRVPAKGAKIKIVTTGSFERAWINWEG